MATRPSISDIVSCSAAASSHALGIALSPFLTYRSAIPFNIITGTDNNGDLLFTDRPSFASGAAGTDVVVTRLGTFNKRPVAGDIIVPRKYGRGPSFFVANLRVAREFVFGAGKKPQTSGPATGGDNQNRTGTNSPFSAAAPQSHDEDEGEGRFKLELSVQIRNLFNTTNGDTPVGNLSSTLFGQPMSVANGFGFGGGRQSGGNRRLRFELQFSF